MFHSKKKIGFDIEMQKICFAYIVKKMHNMNGENGFLHLIFLFISSRHLIALKYQAFLCVYIPRQRFTLIVFASYIPFSIMLHRGLVTKSMISKENEISTLQLAKADF